MTNKVTPSAASDAINTLLLGADLKAFRQSEQDYLKERARVGAQILALLGEARNADLLDQLRLRARG